MASLTQEVCHGKKRASQYQERRPTPRVPAAFIFSGEVIGGRNQMRRENVRGLGGYLGEECILFLPYVRVLMRSNSTKIT